MNPITSAELQHTRFTEVAYGYQREAVHQLFERAAVSLEALERGQRSPMSGGDLATTRFLSESGGYDPAEVDEVIERIIDTLSYEDPPQVPQRWANIAAILVILMVVFAVGFCSGRMV